VRKSLLLLASIAANMEPAYACENARNDLKIDSQDYSSISTKYQQLHSVLVAMEQRCQSIGARMASAAAKMAEAQACESLTESKRLQDDQITNSDDCHTKFSKLHTEVSQLKQVFVSPLSSGAHATFNSIRRDRIVSSRCPKELAAAERQAALAALLLGSTVADIAKTQKNVTAFKEFSEKAKKLSLASGNARQSCVGAQRSVAGGVSKQGVPAAPGLPTGNRDAGKSGLTGVNEAIADERKSDTLLRKQR
jgi:hypothetical protein